MRLVCVGIAVQDIVFEVASHPDRPGKYRASARHEVGGGVAANAAVTAASLGAEVALVSCVGDDPTGDLIVNELNALGVDASGVRRTAGALSPLSAVLIDIEGERLVVNHAGDLFDGAPIVTADEVDGAAAVLTDMRWPGGAVAALQRARELGIPGIVDCDHDPTVNRGEEILAVASHVIFSWPTLETWTGAASPPAALRLAAGRCGAWVAATDGANGTFWLDGTEARHVPAFAVEVVDTLGAGDVFHGAFAAGLMEGATPEAALRLGSAAAAIKCTRRGGRAGIPDREEVAEFLAAPPSLRSET